MTYDISYQRDLSGASMILPALAQTEVGYPRRMILENTIGGFLSIQRCCQQDGESYHYNISSLISLDEYLQHHSLNDRFLKQLIFTLCQAVDQLREYLLTEEYLLLTPETVFVRENESVPFAGTFFFCLYPDERQDIKSALRHWIKYLMEKTDRSDDLCAVMCYELYGLVQKENFCLREFMEALERWALPVQEKEPQKKKRPKQLFSGRRNSGIMKLSGR